MKHIILTLIFLTPVLLYGQVKTKKYFYNGDWKTTDSISAKYITYYLYKDTVKDSGTIRTTTMGGQVLSECEFSNLKNQKRDGLIKLFYDNGQIKLAAFYVDDKSDGEELKYYENGQIKSKAKYSHGNKDGELITYYPSGQLRRKDYFQMDGLIYGNCYSTTGEDTTHFDYEVPAQFPGGESALYNFVSSNVKYPKKARRKWITGKVVVGFTVDKNGELINIHIEESIDPLLDNEALRVVNLINNKWIPGKQEGENVAVYYTLPINFTLK